MCLRSLDNAIPNASLTSTVIVKITQSCREGIGIIEWGLGWNRLMGCCFHLSKSYFIIRWFRHLTLWTSRSHHPAYPKAMSPNRSFEIKFLGDAGYFISIYLNAPEQMGHLNPQSLKAGTSISTRPQSPKQDRTVSWKAINRYSSPFRR